MSKLPRFAASTAARYFGSLEHRDFRTMWLASLSAQAAAWALIVARGWLVFDMTDSSMSVGLVTFAAMAPLFFVPPFAGVLADRFDRRTILLWTYAVNFLHNLILALLVLADLGQTWPIVLLSLVNGSARAVQLPTSQALAANLVPRQALLNALSLNAATLHGSRLVGPAIVTPALAILGAPFALFLCTALYALGFYQITRIKTRSRGAAAAGESILQNFVAGLRYVNAQPLLRTILLLVILHCGLTMAFESLLPRVAQKELGAGPGGFGTLMMGVGAGALVGSFLIGGTTDSLLRGRLFLVTGVLSGVGQMGLAFAPNMAAALGATALMGASQAAFMTLSQATTQSLAADEFRARVASINTFSLGGMMSVMNLANGTLAEHVSVAGLLLLQGSLFAAIMVGAVAAPTPRRVYTRGLPATAPAE